MATQNTTRRQEREHNLRIQASKLLQRMYRAAEGEIELSQTQIAAAKIYLAKTMPDLKAIDHSGEVDVNVQGFIFTTED